MCALFGTGAFGDSFLFSTPIDNSFSGNSNSHSLSAENGTEGTLHDSWNFARRTEVNSASKQKELERDRLRLGSYSRIWQENEGLRSPPAFTPTVQRKISVQSQPLACSLSLHELIGSNGNKNWDAIERQRGEFLRGLNPACRAQALANAIVASI